MDDLSILDDAQINEELAKLDGWVRKGDKITKEFKFHSFPDEVDLVQKLTPYFEENDHHPDIHMFYRKIVFELTRYSVGEKLTQRDFTTAQEIERVYKTM